MIATSMSDNKEQVIVDDYKKYVIEGQHPCIMAKSLFKMENYTLKIYESMSDSESLQLLINDLKTYLEQYNFDGTEFKSFIASFPNNHFATEIDFENALWETLQALHNIDDCDWDHRVSDNPDDANFSLSLGGRAFYVVGLHPESSRIARQAPHTTLVFNLHHQFDKLREMGTYQVVRDNIRKNDEQLQGEINPVLRDFGSESETKQYSGRKVEAGWKCPFHKK